MSEVTGDAVPAVTGNAELQTDVLEEMVAARNYRRWLTALTVPYLGDDPIEIGSGTGDYAQEWAALGCKVTASEGNRELVSRLQERFAGHPLVTVRELFAPVEVGGDHSAVVALNVLEHIPDDEGALRSFGGLLRPGGRVVLFVPAFPVLMSDYDRLVGHQRRYRRRGLAELVDRCGFDVETVRHVNLVGFFAWFLGMRVLRGRPHEGLALSVFDRVVVPAQRRVEVSIAPPFGQSLLVVGRRR